MTGKIAGLLLALCLMSTNGSWAHHGGSLYDSSERITIHGAVTDFRFVFPHVLIYIEAQNDDGQSVVWSGGLTTPNRLARGVGGGGAANNIRWTRDTLQPGDIVAMTGDPARNGAPSMRIRRLISADGTALIGGEEGEESTLVASVPAARQSAAVANAPADLTGVWMRDYEYPWQNYAFTEDPPEMTPWGQERYDASLPTFGARGVSVADTNDPVYQCLPPGTPRIYAHPAPFEIVQTSDRVLLVYEYQHLTRHVFTDGRERREGRPASWMGESVGYWEGDTLVVETGNFNDLTWIDRRGLPHSDQLRVTERIQRSAPNRLTIEILVDDPVAFVEPWTAQREFNRVDWRIEENVCEDNASFATFENEVLEYGESPAE